MSSSFFGRHYTNDALGITQTSSVLRSESLPIFYSTNTFWLYQSGGTSIRECGNLERWLHRRVTAQYASCLKCVLVPALSLPPHERPVSIGSLKTQLEQLVRLVLRGIEWRMPFEALLAPLKTSFAYQDDTLAYVTDEQVRKEVMDPAVDALIALAVDARWAQGDQKENAVVQDTLETWLDSLPRGVRASYWNRRLFLPRSW